MLIKMIKSIFQVPKEEDDYLSNDKQLREEAESRMQALNVLVDVQTRQRGFKGRAADTHN